MTNFLSNAFTFPTIVYTGLLILVVLYWLSSIIGVTDLDPVETEIDADASGLAVWLTRFRLNGIPITLTLSVIIFLSWIICFFLIEFTYQMMEEKGMTDGWVKIALQFWVLILTPALALPITIPLLAPLRPLMAKLKREATGAVANDFIGRTATVRSEKINASHGTVELSDGGAGLILQIRTDKENDYKRGDKVVLKEYLPETNTYKI